MPDPAPTVEPEPTPAGPTVTTPDQLAGQTFIPYESTDRTPAGPLQELEQFTAQYLGIDPGQLVSREGDILDQGSAALFQLLPWPGAVQPVGWVVASHATDEGPDARLRITTREWEDPARVAYAAALTRLAGQA